MIINSTAGEPRIVTDYDITFTNGLCVSVTVDLDAGDIVDYTHTPLATIFRLSEKPSPTDPRTTLPSEEITIYIGHVLTIQSHKRTINPLSPEQREEFNQTIHRLSNTIQ